MKYIVKLLDDVKSVHSFKEVDELTLIRGNATKLYFRLITEEKCGTGTDQVRYIPLGTTVFVETFFDNIDDNLVVCRVGVAAFPTTDKSIYYIDIIPQDTLAFNGMRVTVTEDGVKRNFIVTTDLASEDTGDSRFFT